MSNRGTIAGRTALLLALAMTAHSALPEASPSVETPNQPLSRQPEAPTVGSATLTESVILSTRTPVGDASIRLPAGSVIEIAASTGEWIQIRKAPFSAWIKKPAPSALPSTATSPSPTPVHSAASSRETPPPPPEKTLGLSKGLLPLPDRFRKELSNPDSPLPLLLTGYAGFASLLILILVIVLLRLGLGSKRSSDQPVVSLEAKTPPLPGFIDCPLCKSPLPIDSLTIGRNDCPNCGGNFECE